jgi:hypothetical protein
MEQEMKPLSVALLAFVATTAISATAEAGQCSRQIDALQRQLSAPSTGTPGQTGAMSPENPVNKTQNPPTKPLPPNSAAAQAALDHARQLDQAGKETECQAEVIKAKTAFGAQ